MNQQTRFEICCHEAGHAVLAHLLRTRRVEGLHAIADAAGFVEHGKIRRYNQRQPRAQYENLIMASAAGDQAGLKARLIPWTITGTAPAHTRKPPPPTQHHRAAVFHKIITQSGGQDCELDSAYEERLVKAVYPGTWRQYLYWLHQRTAEIVTRNWPAILQVAGALYHQDYVSRSQFLKILKGSKCAR